MQKCTTYFVSLFFVADNLYEYGKRMLINYGAFITIKTPMTTTFSGNEESKILLNETRSQWKH